MNTYEINEVKRAIESVIGGASASFGRHEPARARTHDWDYIVRMVCMGCPELFVKVAVTQMACPG